MENSEIVANGLTERHRAKIRALTIERGWLGFAAVAGWLTAIILYAM